MQSRLLPKDLTPERITALLASPSFPKEEEGFRRALLMKAQELPLLLQYGLQMVVEYPQITELIGDSHEDIRHDLRLMGQVTLHPLEKDKKMQNEVHALLTKESMTTYDAILSALWKQSVVVDFSGTGTLHLTSTYFGTHNELLVIHVHAGVKASVIEEIKGEENVVAGRTVVAIVEKGGSLEYRSRLAPETQGTLFLRQYGVCRESASLSWFDVSRASAHVISRTTSTLLGIHAESAIYMTASSSGNRILDIEHRMNHQASHTHSRIATAGVGGGTSRTIYRGDIAVSKDTVGVDGKQEGRFLVLTPTAKIDAVPALDIGSHDVKSSHALSVGYLSPTMLFYPRLRGVHADDAVGFLVSGMMKRTLSRGGASERDAYEMSRIGEALMKTTESL